ncbi:MAG: phage major tail protein, TP901-1 family [Rubellimicrobium sp.]|nr:phage major tail protein, TP901-1 family [Rubellimicrobium sp.]
MAAQNGKDLLVKIDMNGEGLFETVAGLRATRISFNAETVDVTSLESQGGWRELLAGAGVRSAAISGSGVFKDAASDERVRQIFFDGQVPAFQVIIPDFGTVEGPFQITSIDYAGGVRGEATYELSLASAGELAFLAFDAQDGFSQFVADGIDPDADPDPGEGPGEEDLIDPEDGAPPSSPGGEGDEP